MSIEVGARSGRGGSERALIACVGLATMLLPLNSTMIAVALPDVADDFDTSAGSASWLVSSYLIAMASLQPLAGKLGDRVGRRVLVVGGLVAFAVASALAPLAPSLVVLAICRLGQASSGALVFPNAIALVRERLPAERR